MKNTAQLTIETQGEHNFNVQVKIPTINHQVTQFPIEENKAELIAKLMCDFMKRELMTPDGKLVSLRVLQEKNLNTLKLGLRKKFPNINEN